MFCVLAVCISRPAADEQSLRMTQRDESTVKVVGYNIHSCVGNDGFYSVERISSVVRRLDAEIVCLQEVEANDILPGRPSLPTRRRTRVWSGCHCDDQAASIANLSGFEYHVFVPAIKSLTFGKLREKHADVSRCDVSGNHHDPDWVKEQDGETKANETDLDSMMGRFGIALLSKHPIVKLRVHSYRRYKKKTPRNAIACLIRLPDGTSIWVVNTHLGCHFSGREQYQQAGELADFVNSLDQDNEIRGVVVCGDFNSPPWFRSMEVLRKSGMCDMWESPTVAAGSRHGGTFPSSCRLLCFERLLRLDYIFLHHSGRRRISCKEVHVDDGVSSSVASDHLPLIAAFFLQ